MFKFLTLLLLPVSIYAAELEQCPSLNVKAESINNHYEMSDGSKPIKSDGKLLFAVNAKMKRYAIDGAIQLGWDRVAPNCGKFYDDVATFLVLNYDERGISQYKLNHRVSF